MPTFNVESLVFRRSNCCQLCSYICQSISTTLAVIFRNEQFIFCEDCIINNAQSRCDVTHWLLVHRCAASSLVFWWPPSWLMEPYLKWLYLWHTCGGANMLGTGVSQQVELLSTNSQICCFQLCHLCMDVCVCVWLCESDTWCKTAGVVSGHAMLSSIYCFCLFYLFTKLKHNLETGCV